MKQSAPLAQESSGFEISTLGFMAHALGKMTGGLIVDKVLDLGNTDITLMVIQAIYQDAGDKRLVAGSTACMDCGGCCVLFDDGAIEHLVVKTDGGSISAESHAATEEELKDSEAYILANSTISQIVNMSLEKDGKFEGDDYTSRTAIDAAAAIRNKFDGVVHTMIRKGGVPAAGYVSEISGLSQDVTMGEAIDMVKTRNMTSEEMAAERKLLMDTLGTQTIFNSPVGQA